MKKILLSSAAMILAFSFSAFAGDNKVNKDTKTTTEAPAETKVATTGTECYRDAAGNFHVKEGNGTCLDDENRFCTYLYIGDSEPGMENDNDPLSYQPVPGTQGKRWQPL